LMQGTLIKAALFSAVAFSVVLTACSDTENPSSTASKDVTQAANTNTAKLLPVKVASLVSEPLLESRVFTGTTRAVSRAIIRSQVAGRVARLPVTLGKEVKSGDLLLELYNPEANPAAQSAERQWRQLESQQTQRQRDFDRISSLYKNGTVSKQEFEQVRTDLESLTDQTLSAKEQFSRAQRLNLERLISAPFAGVVTTINTDIGEVVSPGQALLGIADPSKTEVEMAINYDIATNLKVGDLVSVILPFQQNSARQGMVTELSPFRERGALPTVVLAFPEQQIRPGVAVHARFDITKGDGFTVPMSALVRKGDGAVIYRINSDNQAVAVPVTLGLMQQNGIEISATKRFPLTAGEQFVVTGSHRLFDGASVEIIP
ncbi:MAG: efflux RND transporter periplasmic adaptor subunit, partial [Oleibacter sp.]|nr:efflux RND transporter periplasmic adaptor subunit [Thalassolituus sp.]